MNSAAFKLRLTNWSENSKAKEQRRDCLNAKSTKLTSRLAKRSCSLARNHLGYSG